MIATVSPAWYLGGFVTAIFAGSLLGWMVRDTKLRSMDLRYPLQVELPELRRQVRELREAIDRALQALKADENDRAKDVLEIALKRPTALASVDDQP